MSETIKADYYLSRPTARLIALLSICLSNFVNSISHSAVGIAIPVIAKDLEAEAVLVSWIPTAFLLSSAITLIPAGRLADIYGRKRIYLIGLIIFLITSFLAYFANSIEWVIFFRLFHGIGTGMMFATGMAIIMGLFDEQRRGMALGIAAGILYTGLACGPLLGGWLTAEFGWRSVFLFPGFLSILSGIFLITSIKGDWKNENAQRVDWTGALIFTLLITSIFIGVSFIPQPISIIILIIGACLGLLFYSQQSQSRHPLVNFRAIVENKVFFNSLLASVFTYASNIPIIFLFSLYLQYIMELSPIEAGQILLVQAVTMAIIAPFAGKLSDVFEPRIIASLGCLIMSSAFGLLTQVNADTSLYFITACLITLGFGFGLFTTPNNNGALSSVNRQRLGIASALLNLSRTTGNIIGTTLMLLFVTLYIGNETINPSNYDALLLIVKIVLGLSCFYTILGAYFSYARGNIR